MKGLVLILITFFSITSAQQWECPAVENLGNCLCYPTSRTIRCIDGANILPKLSNPVPIVYNLIVFQNWNLSSIEKEVLGNAIFKKIVIENNQALEKLPIFQDSPEVLIIRNNPLLQKKSLFATVHNLKSTKIIQLENNTLIKEIPSYAFNNSLVLKQILLQNSQIEKIAEEAFLGLPKLKEIRLDHNKMLSKLEGKCFDVDNESSIIDINLNSNTMIKIADLKGITSKKTIINLNLENINLTRFLRSDFLRFLANNKSTINLSGNNITCSCDDEIKWVLDENYLSLSRQLIHLNCTNHKKEIFRLNRKEICGEETTTPSTGEPKPPTQQPTRTEVSQTSEPSDPTEQKPRTDPLDVKSTTEPNTPSEQPTRKETVITPTTTEPNTPNEQPLRKET